MKIGHFQSSESILEVEYQQSIFENNFLLRMINSNRAQKDWTDLLFFLIRCLFLKQNLVSSKIISTHLSPRDPESV